jgi:hypothetical protein
MSNILQITEFSAIGLPISGSGAQVAQLPSGSGSAAAGGDNTQDLDFTSGVATAAALKTSTTFVRFRCAAGSACSIQWGTAPGAPTSANMTLSAGQVEYFFLNPADIGLGLIFKAIGSPN